MPRSTSNAVLTPGRVKPSSTKVMATAGCMPTTITRASISRDRLAMSAIIRPMNESTMSSAEMSSNTPRAEVALMRSVRSSCKRMASLSCMST